MQSLTIHPFARRLQACCDYLSRHQFVVGCGNTLCALDEGMFWTISADVDFRTIQPGDFIVQWPDLDRQIMSANAKLPSDSAAYQAWLRHTWEGQDGGRVIGRLWMPTLQRWAKEQPAGASFSLPHGNLTVRIDPSVAGAESVLSLMHPETVVTQPEHGVWLTTSSPEDLQSLVSTLHGWVLSR